MKLLRFKHNNEIKFGIMERNEIVTLEENFLNSVKKTSIRLSLNEVELLSPVLPSKFVCVGLNYMDHANEMKEPLPSEPVLFLKPSTSVNHPEYPIFYPKQTKELHYEAELVVVIGKPAKDVKIEEANNYILGYTCGNDVTARDLQRKDVQWTRSKSFDSFAPIGPWIETEIDPNSLYIKLILNNEIKQRSNTSNLIFKPNFLVSFISSVMTLLPGDVIMTGTPSGVGPMKAGDEVSVVIENIGTLTNKVV
ncbi:2-keto-4-pentenoate hydratase/2-oxohepta-3-ene-1,7-dioic acid hydratase (catechol pathway) [Thermodesulfobium acidiphilum]|uniref:2-keto-4-pentenoate hydratase/2-oxohepta-3-ene-1,7-dioic acid hydratase (Catechol pathway) n=1 Tax=Thermodesulfobium acidiphilum TaxID=1794699 RepID=A0A2R4W0E7_THEAF|nr:fumarylacetoacetate hydrolase family protein [Thermodesulfobium acidiphilum]AWB10184.1 2-keto-4-pentenoate hydratase/2-oxohepta-3-ene-1,7-dioic acid hydratase (catechol pathway) [Thermodesulfobium acidiphilum]